MESSLASVISFVEIRLNMGRPMRLGSKYSPTVFAFSVDEVFVLAIFLPLQIITLIECPFFTLRATMQVISSPRSH
jgi:hypothetical protein